MANAIAAQLHGFDYQARWFWLQVCRLFNAYSKVDRIGFEHSAVKSFDDVVVIYKPGMSDYNGHPLTADYYQVKFHMTAAGAVTWQRLMDPAFINATSVSLLQRLRDAQQQRAPSGFGVRFFLYSPWTIDPEDLLADMVLQTDGSIRIAQLLQGGSRSRYGKLRAVMRSHLNLDNDDELVAVLTPLRIQTGPTLSQLEEELNVRLQLAGFVPVEDGAMFHPYDDLARKLFSRGRHDVTKSDIEQIGRQAGLWVGRQVVVRANAVSIGVRSFLRWAEALEDETESMLSLLQYFEGRHPISPEIWQDHVLPALARFFHATVARPKRYHLHLHAHASIAFACGYLLDPKSGIDVVPIQSTSRGPSVWCSVSEAVTAKHALWRYEEYPVSESGTELVLAISLRHDILADVRSYVARRLPSVSRIVHVILPVGVGSDVVRDGAHAKDLAEQLCIYLKTERTREERGSALHLFASAPNGFLFFLGQLGRGFGHCRLYEYDLEGNTLGAYKPSMMFPFDDARLVSTA